MANGKQLPTFRTA